MGKELQYEVCYMTGRFLWFVKPIDAQREIDLKK